MTLPTDLATQPAAPLSFFFMSRKRYLSNYAKQSRKVASWVSEEAIDISL